MIGHVYIIHMTDTMLLCLSNIAGVCKLGL